MILLRFSFPLDQHEGNWLRWLAADLMADAAYLADTMLFKPRLMYLDRYSKGHNEVYFFLNCCFMIQPGHLREGQEDDHEKLCQERDIQVGLNLKYTTL